MEPYNAILVDVRFMPRSRVPHWNSGVLARRFGDGAEDPANGRYVWLKEFGNRNYKGTFDQIEIVDFPAGVGKLQPLIATGRNIILFCGCADVNTCHRKLLAQWLLADKSRDVHHLDVCVRQQSLF